MRHEQFLPIIELLGGLSVLAAFVLLLVGPAAIRLAGELGWLLGSFPLTLSFGLHPHRLAEARYVPSLMFLGGSAALLVCYRWLSSRRRS